jgi:cyclic-di-AMP phosphodiesterase PgpH
MPSLQELKLKDNLKLKILLGLVTVILIVFMFPKGESIESEVPVGSIWIHDDLIASVSFPIYKDAGEYKKELKEASESVFPVYIKVDNIVHKISDSVNSYNSYLLTDLNNSGDNNTFLNSVSYEELKNIRNKGKGGSSTKRENLQHFFSETLQILSYAYSADVNVRSDNLNIDSVAIRIRNVDKIEATTGFLTLSQFINKINQDIYRRNYSKEFKNALVEYVDHFIFPNLIYNPKLTQEELHQAESNVSKYSGIVN